MGYMDDYYREVLVDAVCFCFGDSFLETRQSYDYFHLIESFGVALNNLSAVLDVKSAFSKEFCEAVSELNVLIDCFSDSNKWYVYVSDVLDRITRCKIWLILGGMYNEC